MAESVQRESPLTLADFAVGDGSLVAAAVKRWPGISIFASDIDPELVTCLRLAHPQWRVDLGDMLDDQFHARLNSIPGSLFDVILLNPPFSCRGGMKISSRIANDVTVCSVAMAFVIRCLDHLSSDGEIVAILPSNSLHSQKDKEAWSIVTSSYAVSVVRNNDRNTFRGCYPNTTIVRISAKHSNIPSGLYTFDKTPKARPLEMNIVRGTLQMPRFDASRETDGAAKMIHSTSLTPTGIINTKPVTPANRRILRSPAVLIQRVGKPYPHKIAAFTDTDTIVPSDCIIGLQLQSAENARYVEQFLRANWTLFEDLYSGTCAKYITVERLTNFLIECGFVVRNEALTTAIDKPV